MHVENIHNEFTEICVQRKSITQKKNITMTQENKAKMIRFLWNLASAILAAIGTALGVACTMG